LPLQRFCRARNRVVEAGVERLAEIIGHGHIMPVELRISWSASFFCSSLRA
jgi:hypothetical protein